MRRAAAGSINDAIQAARAGDTLIIPSGFYTVGPGRMCSAGMLWCSSDRVLQDGLLLVATARAPEHLVGDLPAMGDLTGMQEPLLMDRPLRINKRLLLDFMHLICSFTTLLSVLDAFRHGCRRHCWWTGRCASSASSWTTCGAIRGGRSCYRRDTTWWCCVMLGAPAASASMVEWLPACAWFPKYCFPFPGTRSTSQLGFSRCARDVTKSLHCKPCVQDLP